ncbi:hypothetical protein LARV_00087 [Longilinea arvoryzae]|uniref:Uncharacterized protein n=1 Tax=Longilinea arvoryzae TaxID=360412 RepID=A0A0S7BEE5_9CHLR|nr:hypothetical protein LARV_00087 [Longilinea arvoryzae]
MKKTREEKKFSFLVLEILTLWWDSFPSFAELGEIFSFFTKLSVESESLW